MSETETHQFDRNIDIRSHNMYEKVAQKLKDFDGLIVNANLYQLEGYSPP